VFDFERLGGKHQHSARDRKQHIMKAIGEKVGKTRLETQRKNEIVNRSKH
jgi:hypothetical protein